MCSSLRRAQSEPTPRDPSLPCEEWPTPHSADQIAHSGLVLGLRRRKYDPYYGYENNSSLICGSRDLTIGWLNKYVIID